MPHLRPLGAQVGLVVRVGLDADGHRLDDLEAVAGEADDLLRVVGQQADLPHAEIEEDLRAEAVLAQVGREAELEIGLHRVEALLLQLVGVDLRGEADAAPLLPHVEQDAAAGLLDLLQRGVELAAAIAAARAEDIAGQAFAVDAHEHRLAVGDVALHQREVVLLFMRRAVEQQVERAVIGRQLHALLELDQLFAAAAILDQVEDGAELELVLFLELEQVGQARHGAVVLDDLAEDAGGIEAGEAREVDRRLGVAAALQHAARLGAERENVAGLDEIARLRFRDRPSRRMVLARSSALMPVVMSCVASTETVKSVLKLSRLSRTMRLRPRRVARSLVIGAQIRPRPKRIMKLMFSAVAFSAARIRSPSFSRSASSTTMTGLPARMSRRTDSMESMPVGFAFAGAFLRIFHPQQRSTSRLRRNEARSCVGVVIKYDRQNDVSADHWRKLTAIPEGWHDPSRW